MFKTLIITIESLLLFVVAAIVAFLVGAVAGLIGGVAAAKWVEENTAEETFDKIRGREPVEAE